jgi:WD40 repeat protein
MVTTVARAEFDVFISYNSSDHAPVERIARGLKERGLTVFLDRWELIPGRSWPQALEEQLARCRCALIVLGPSGMGSWQQRERQVALDRQARESNFGVIPVLLPGADPALGFLSLNTWVDLREGLSDPRALDLLAAAIRSEPPSSLSEQSRQAASEVCPYRSLEVFREEDAPFFFGRDAFTERLVERIATRSLLAVVGASGSGKSSVVRAGLIPALRQGANGRVWDLLTLTPGVEPLAALVRALDPPPDSGLIAARAHLNTGAARLRDGEVTLKQLTTDLIARQPGTDRLLLVIDQFEELATLAGDGKDQARFIDLLLEATGEGGPLTVLVTLRSDFYTQLVRRRDLNDRLQDAVVNIGPLSRAAPEGGRSELETIIRCPAEAVGLDFEDGLVPRIIADVGDEPGNLPLLEYLLTELWRRRGRGLLTHEAYEALGGVHAAIARRADEAYKQLDTEQQQAARRLFLTLVRPGEGQQDTRAPAPFPQDPLEVEVARRFSGPKVRLLVASKEDPSDPLRDPVVELSHEALIRNWTMLRRWVDENRETLRARERVRQRMGRWREMDEREDLLLPAGLELEEGRRLLQADTDVSIDEVRGYIERSIAAEQSRIAEREARQEAERQRELAVQRQKRRLVSSALLVSLLLLALAGWQWWQADLQRDEANAQQLEAESARAEALEASEQAKRQAERADRERDLAQAQRLAATAAKVLDENPGETALAAMLAVESQEKHNTPEANAVLRTVLALTPSQTRLAPISWAWSDTAISADGRMQVYRRVDSWGRPTDDETSARSSIHVLEGTKLESAFTQALAGYAWPVVSPDGRWLAASGFARRLVVMDLKTGDQALNEPTRGSTFPVFSTDGQKLYVACQDGTIEVRRAPSWERDDPLTFPVGPSWEAYPSHVFSTPGEGTLKAALSADGETLLVVDGPRAAIAVSTDTSGVAPLDLPIDEFAGPWGSSDRIVSGTVSPTASLGLTRQWSGKTVLWDLDKGARQLTFTDESRPTAAAFSPDGLMVVTATYKGAVLIRDVDDGALLHRLNRGAEVTALAFSPAGDVLVSAGENGKVVMWDIATGQVRRRFEHDSPALALAFDPADGTLLTGTENGALTRFDPATGQIQARRQFNGAIAAIDTNGSSHTIAVGVRETGAKALWDEAVFVDRATNRELSHFSREGESRIGALSPDGSRFATYDPPARKQVTIWSTSTGKVLLQVPIDAKPLAFSSDGRRLRLHNGFGPLLVVDAATGETLHDLGEPGGINDVYGKSHGDFFVTRGVDKSLRGWDLVSGDSRWHTVPEHRDASLSLSFNGTTFAYYGESEQAIEVFESATGKRLGAIPTEKPRAFVISDDGTRLLTARPVVDEDKEQGRRESIRVELWDVAAARLLSRRTIENSRSVGFEPLDSKHVAVKGNRTHRKQWLDTWMEVVQWDTGEVAWSLSEQRGGFYAADLVEPARNRILVRSSSALEMRSLGDGELIWRKQGKYLTAAAGIKRTSLVALAHATSEDEDAVIRLVDRETGEERRRITVGGYPRDVAATADGTSVVAAIEREHWYGLRVWRVDDGRLVREIEMDENPEAILPLRDPDRVAVNDFAQNLRVFDLRTGKEVHRIAHMRFADRVANAGNADRAVTIAGASLRYWDSKEGREIAHRVSQGEATSVSISPDGKQVAYLTSRPRGTEKSVELPMTVIWTPESNAEPVMFPAEGIKGIAFGPTGRRLLLNDGFFSAAAARWLGNEPGYIPQSRGRLLRLMDVSTLQTLLTLRPLRNGEFEAARLTEDGSVLLVSEVNSYQEHGGRYRRHSLRAFDVASGRELARTDFDGRFLVVPRSSNVVFAGIDWRWREFDPTKMQIDSTLPGVANTTRVPDKLGRARSSSRLLVTNYWNGARVHDLSNGQSLALAHEDDPFNVLDGAIDKTGRLVALSLREGEWTETSAGEIVIKDAISGQELARLHTERAMWGVEFVDDGNAVVISQLRNQIPKEPESLLLHWNWHTGATITLVRDNPVTNFAVSDDGKLFATTEGGIARGDTPRVIGRLKARVWNATDGAQLTTLPLDFDASGIVFSQDRRYLAVASETDTAVFRTDTWTRAFRLKLGGSHTTRTDYVLAKLAQSSSADIGFGERGRDFVIGLESGAFLVDLERGKESRLREGWRVEQLALSPGGDVLALRGQRVISVWDIAAGEPLIRFDAPGISNLTFAGESGRELLAVRDGNIVRLRWQPGELRRLACEAFTDGDWRRGRARIAQQSGVRPCAPPRH